MNTLKINLSNQEINHLTRLLENNQSSESESILTKLRAAILENENVKRQQAIEQQKNEAWDAARAAHCQSDWNKKEKAWNEYCKGR